MNKFNKRRDINSMVSMMGKVKNPAADTVANLKSIEDVLAAGESSGSGGITDAIIGSTSVTAPSYEGKGSKEGGSTGPSNLSDEQVNNLKERKKAKDALKSVNNPGTVVAKMGIKRKTKKAVKAGNYSTSNDENAKNLPDDGYSSESKRQMLIYNDSLDPDADRKKEKAEEQKYKDQMGYNEPLKPTL